jgi:hypothetical protein
MNEHRMRRLGILMAEAFAPAGCRSMISGLVPRRVSSAASARAALSQTMIALVSRDLFQRDSLIRYDALSCAKEEAMGRREFIKVIAGSAEVAARTRGAMFPLVRRSRGTNTPIPLPSRHHVRAAGASATGPSRIRQDQSLGRSS